MNFLDPVRPASQNAPMANALAISRSLSLAIINALVMLAALYAIAAAAVWAGDTIGSWFGINIWKLIAIWALSWYVVRNWVLHTVSPILVGLLTVLVSAAGDARGWPLWAAAAVIAATVVAVRIAKLLADVIYDW